LQPVSWKKRTETPKKQRAEFLVEVLKTDNHLKVVEYAGRYFNEVAKRSRPRKGLLIEEHLEWWEKNKETFEEN
jgi:hypothetical protein